MLGARRARKIANRRHCTHFARDFLVHVRPVQRHKSRGTQEETGRRTDAPARRRPALTGTRDVESHWLWKALGCKKCRMPRRVIYLKCSATYEGNTKLSSPQTTHTSRSPTDTDIRHGHGSLPRAEAAPTEPTRHPPGMVARVLRSGCYTTGSLTLGLSPVAITPTTG